MESKAGHEGLGALSTALVQELILKKLDCPAVFKGMIDDWPCRRWTLQEWSQKFGEKKIQFRIGPNKQPPRSDPLWETDCRYIHSTLEEFDRWQNGGMSEPSKAITNEMDIEGGMTFSDITHETHWAYADYKHMLKLFEVDDNIHNSLDWSKFGFEDRKGQDSTIWIGSRHCHTPCHYDTYGCNLVAQLIGKKRWILYPPSVTDCLYPRRIPYEESSVFSAVNIDKPNVDRFPKFSLASPYVITLEEGDVLFVPHKWWHFVKSLNTSLSINSWIPMDVDDERRLEEAVTRTVLSSYMSAHSKDEDLKWLNPTEEYTAPEVNIQYVKEALKICLAGQQNDADAPKISPFPVKVIQDEESQAVGSPSEENRKNVNAKRIANEPLVYAKRSRTESTTELEQVLSQFSAQIKVLEPMKYTTFIEEISLCERVTDLPTDENLKKNLLMNEVEDDKFKVDLLNALVNPEVVSLICKKLQSAYS